MPQGYQRAGIVQEMARVCDHAADVIHIRATGTIDHLRKDRWDNWSNVL